jgi:CheY-like chemotaxis protein/anti-sigma regulatory factor (Ser/Thr protein kinase)
MREFYRPREPQLTLNAVDVNRMVEQVIELTRARWSDVPQQQGAVIELNTELEPNLPPIMGVEVELRDALTNLVLNAADAMPEGGTLTLRTAAVRDANNNAIVKVEVADSGVGMDEETRRRCLEPFFTTKGERGTGLGLAMVYGMAQRHSGELEIDSARGEGTTVRLLFPAYFQEFRDTVRMPAASRPQRRLRVLLIDDDPMIIKAMQDALESDGHSIVAASGGQAGIDAFTAALGTDKPFSLVFTDLGMPRVDGRKVADAIKSLSPRTPVVMLTGWGQRMLADNDVPPNVDRVLSKPPRLQEVRMAISELSQ